MAWSEETYCRVCGWTMAGLDDMCPNRDNVCVYCCLKCGRTECDFKGVRTSLDDTIDSHREGEIEDAIYVAFDKVRQGNQELNDIRNELIGEIFSLIVRLVKDARASIK